MRDDRRRELVEAAVRGDRMAFAALVEGHRRAAAGVAYSILKEEHLAADAVQEAFFKAYQALRELKDQERFVPWFLSIVRSTATDMVRRQVRWGTREVSFGDELPGEGLGSLTGGQTVAPPERLMREEEAGRLRQALESLADEYREVILLKHMEGRSYREISRLLKLSVRAVESRLFRARQQLHRKLSGNRDVGPGSGEDRGGGSSTPRNGVRRLRAGRVPLGGPQRDQRMER